MVSGTIATRISPRTLSFGTASLMGPLATVMRMTAPSVVPPRWDPYQTEGPFHKPFGAAAKRVSLEHRTASAVVAPAIALRGRRPRAHRSKSGMGPHPRRASGPEGFSDAYAAAQRASRRCNASAGAKSFDDELARR